MPNQEIEHDCLFCNKLTGHVENVTEWFPEFKGSALLVAKSPHFYMTLEGFSPLPGKHPYYLLVPKPHLTGFAYVPQSFGAETNELVQFAKDLTGAQSMVMIENGAYTNGHKVQSVYHAHKHLIALSEGMNLIGYMPELLKARGLNFIQLSRMGEFDDFSIVSALRRRLNGHPANYAFFRQDNCGLLVVSSPDNNIPSQLFKGLVAQVAQTHFFDWKTAEGEELDSCRARLAEYPHRDLII
ncbi:hypothetical protein GYA19_05210 [Candidatus Beckwithbacteria bacterium]|nr:hypothetical protein [Candidatus Beckwithbacteria bacterium]